MNDFLSFSLTEDFVAGYADRQPNWGFSIGGGNYLSELVYVNKYSALKEDGTKEQWYETCQRCIEGMYSILKDHCKKNKTTWNDLKAQKSARDAYDRMWNFKWMPPGRGLQHMGREAIHTRQDSSFLQNCAYLTTAKLSAHSAWEATGPFSRMMEMSMCGIGVGFDTRGAGNLSLHQPSLEKKEIHSVEDSREGWAAAITVLLESYFFKNRGYVDFDYSPIRPAGAMLKSFGGRASGPQPLIDCVERIRFLLDEREDDKLNSRDIVDIMNLIGKAVVAGGARRSAQIAFGETTDMDYVSIKDWNLPENKLRTDPDVGWAWNSNNSVFVDGEISSDLIEKTILNGEPGYMWLDLAQQYGRMVDPADNKDYRAMGGNPCFTGDTLVGVADGRGAVRFDELATTGDDVPVYSVNPESGAVEIKWGRNPRMTRQNADLVEIVFNDKTTLRVTPDHKFLLRDGTRKEAAKLAKGDSLPAFSKRVTPVKEGGNDYVRVCTDIYDSRASVFEHRLIAKFFDPELWDLIYDDAKTNGWIKGGLVVHHKDYDALNNAPENLGIMTYKDHASLHAAQDHFGEKNGMFGKRHSDETKAKIGAKTSERLTTEEQRLTHGEAIRDGMTEESRQKISDSRHLHNLEYYLAQEAATDLNTVWIEDRLYAVKNCIICEDEMILPWKGRHGVFCSRVCVNKNESHIEKRTKGIRARYETRSADILEKQTNTYNDLLIEYGRPPMRKEWEQACKVAKVPFRINAKSENPNILKSFDQLRQLAEAVNHRVVEVRFLTETEDVFNITVDDNYTIAIVTAVEGMKMTGVFTPQCLEQTLEPWECCTLVETFPSKHEDFNDFRETLKHAYLYGKAVTLLPTAWPETNEVMARNRRIGCSMSGLAEFVETKGWSALQSWQDEGYQFIDHRDKKYSEWLAVRESIKKTSIKPSGTVSLVASVTAGVHWPVSAGNHIRRVRYSVNDPLVSRLIDAGYPCEPMEGDPENTVVVTFVTQSADVRSEREVSIWEKAELAVMSQRWWADNQVSATITFLPSEENQIAPLLASKTGQIKGISFLPLRDEAVYAQAPYEAIDVKAAEKFVKKIKYLNNLYAVGSEAIGDKFCDSDVCTI